MENNYRVQHVWIGSPIIRQYTGGHNETWGGLILNIDSGVSEGLVASLRLERVYLPLILRGFEAPPSAKWRRQA